METDRLLAVLVHPLGYLTSFLGPLIFLLISNDYPEAKAHSKQALNLQLTLIIAWVVGALTVIFIIGIFILLAAAILGLVFFILAMIKAANGEEYRIPVAIQFFK